MFNRGANIGHYALYMLGAKHGFGQSTDPNANCTTGDVRLRGGASDNEGRVEICYDNHWGALCDNDWDNNDAAVVCRQLGLSTEGECLKRMKREDECVGVFWKRKGNRKDTRENSENLKNWRLV